MIEDNQAEIKLQKSQAKRSKTVNVARAALMVIKSYQGLIEQSLYKRTEASVYDMIEAFYSKDIDIEKSILKVKSYIRIIKDNNVEMSDECLLLIKGLDHICEKDIAVSLSEIEECINEVSPKPIIKDKIENKPKQLVNVFLNEQASPRHKGQQSSMPQPENISIRKTGRKSEVLSNITSTPMSIKEIASKILGCSEKTVQRELNSLLEEGLIIRVGEKRWSRYMLK